MNHYKTYLTLMVMAASIAQASWRSELEVTKISYKGWKDAIELRNDTVHVVVVPSIGRIMHYGFLDGKNILYTNPEMYGRQLVPGATFMKDGKPANVLFGGDRLVTLPEDMIDRVLTRRINTDPWQDGRPWKCKRVAGGVMITSPVSQIFGVQLSRTLRLEPHGSRLWIDQKMVKLQPASSPKVDAVPLTIWNLTQLPSPRQTWQPCADNSVFKNGIYTPPWSQKRIAGNYVIQDGMIRLTPNKEKSQKIGTDARGWVAGWTGSALLIERFNYIEGGSYPEGGTSTAVYTNPTFTEMECLSPQKVMAVGDSMEYTIRWELHVAEDEQSSVHILKNL